MAKTLSKTGISTGQDILAGHITQSVDALTGIDAYDITISGSLTVNGPINGTTNTTNNLTSSYAITASYALNGGSGGGFTPSLSTDLPAQNITASANISASGYVSASVINVGGGTFTSASLAAGGSGGFIPSLSTDLPAQNITASANISASGNLTALNLNLFGGGLDIKNAGAQSYARFYCESSNAHYTELKAQPHALYSGNPVTLLPAYDFDFAKPKFNANITASGDISASGILSIPGFPNVSASLANATGGGGSAAGTDGMIQLSDGASGFKTGTNSQFYYDNTGGLVVGDGYNTYYISQSIAGGMYLTLGDATDQNNPVATKIRIPNGGTSEPIQITGSLDILGNITASGDISASGNVYASNITASSITATTVTSTNLGGSIVGYRPIVKHTSNFNSTSSYAGRYNIVGGTLAITVTTGSTPTDLTPGMEWDFFQTSSGNSFTFTEGTGVEIISRNNHKKLAAIGSAATLKYISGQTFHLVGDLTI